MFHFDNSYSKLSPNLFTRTNPVQVRAPKTILFNSKLAKELGLDFNSFSAEEIAGFFSGNIHLSGSDPLAQAYAGHQFGYFTMLGDGRAVLLGEHLTPSDQRFDIQLKGSGQTAYSRKGDGRATLRAMLREYLISEAMRGLRIPSSRSLAVVTTGEKVYRDEMHEGAVLTRVSNSHIRVGTFEYISHHLSKDELYSFTKYAIDRHYPEIKETENQVLEFLKAVIEKQIELIVNWMSVGFIHGVMNTDNMSVAGETFDYGPCAFMNSYNPKTVFSSIDTGGRYAFGNQPSVALWNLTRFAETLLPIIHSDSKKAIQQAEEVLNSFQPEYEKKWGEKLGMKIGFTGNSFSEPVKNLAIELLDWMKENKADYTNTFLFIQGNLQEFQDIYNEPDFLEWHERWKKLLTANGISISDAVQNMKSVNPVFIPRNHQVELALNYACYKNNYSLFNQLLNVAAFPYQNNSELSFLKIPPENNDMNYKTFCGT